MKDETIIHSELYKDVNIVIKKYKYQEGLHASCDLQISRNSNDLEFLKELVRKEIDKVLDSDINTWKDLSLAIHKNTLEWQDYEGDCIVNEKALKVLVEKYLKKSD